MALIKIAAASSSETAFCLRQRLGPIYNWEDRLADMRRGKVISGPILLPYNKSMHARHWRPMYAPADIAAFIAAYRAYDHRAQSGIKAQVQILETDDADHRHWTVRRLLPARAA